MGVDFFGPRATNGFPMVAAFESGGLASRGVIPGFTVNHKFGRNPTAGMSSEDIWFQGGALTWLTAAVQMDLVSSSANDDATPTTSTGAQTVFVEGLDSNFEVSSETISLNGTTLVTTVNSYIRIQSMTVVLCGTYSGTNEGDITIRVTGGGAIQGDIETGIGVSQKSHFTVPNGQSAVLTRFALSVDSTKSAQASLFVRENADDIVQPFGASHIIHIADGVSGAFQDRFFAFPIFPTKTDIWWSSNAGVANTAISVDYDLALLAEALS